MDVGDFIIKRADGLFAYQLAVVIDDADAGITDIVRGADLLESTTRQLYLQEVLNLKTPKYTHLPIAINAVGEKLSKQTEAKPIDTKNPVPQIYAALDFLGQEPPKELAETTLPEIWKWAIQNWYLAKVPRCRARTYNANAGHQGELNASRK
jgi:glutamyl-Q tRNA(Asp) synthetase